MEELQIGDQLEAGHYVFTDTPAKVSVTDNIKRHNNSTRKLWLYMQKMGYDYYGVVRNWTAVFEMTHGFFALHHFVDEKPRTELMGEEGVKWRKLLDVEQEAGQLLAQLEAIGFSIVVPRQAFTDAFLMDVLQLDYDWHMESPKHKLMIWAIGETNSFLVEFFVSTHMPPYGVDEPIEWPDLGLALEFEQFSLFESFDGTGELPVIQSNTGETIELSAEVDEDALGSARAAIAKVMQENSIVLVSYSGGKDSHTMLLLSLEFLLAHPDCKTELRVVSANTGVENPLIVEHIESVKKAVESLPVRVAFDIVEPEEGDGYLTCVFGKGYQPPSQLFKWCVRRMKVAPARKHLESFVQPGETVCLLLGSRSAESATRARSVKKFFGSAFYGDHPVSGVRTCAPIQNFTATDVVTYLVRHQAPWDGYPNHRLINLYGSAAGGWSECPVGAAITDENEAVSACGGKSSRFGCWSCSVVRSDQSMQNLSMEYPELKPYHEMRTIFKMVQDIRYGSLTGYQRHRGNKMGAGLGDLTIDIRTILLTHLKRLEIPVKESEVIEIYKEIMNREISEGIPVTKRFRDALFALLPVHPVVVSMMYNPIFDPWGCGVDRFTEADQIAIDKIMARKRGA